MVLSLAFFVAVIAELVLPIQLPLTSGSLINKTPTVNITIYGGEISNSTYGFGSDPNHLSSPGPTLQFRSTDVVNLTFVNKGQVMHAFAITNAPKTGSTVLFGATVASKTNPLMPGMSGYVIFAPNVISRNLFYICPVPGHAERGMYGSVIVTAG